MGTLRAGKAPAAAVVLRTALAMLLAACAVAGIRTAVASPAAGGPGKLYLPHVPGEILVKFKPVAGPNEHASVRAQLDATRKHTFRSGAEHWKLGPGVTTEQAIERLRNNPHVQYVEPNYLFSTAIAPNDPSYSDLYGLHNTGQTGGAPGADIRAERAWDLTTGSRNVLVAVIDTGVDYTHPDLAANIWTNPGEIPGNGIDDDGNGFVDDVHGWDFLNDDNDPADDNSHGTHVSGTIGAVGNNGVGVVGVAWNVSIVPLKFLGATGGGGTAAGAVQAIDYATRLGVDVMSNSWGGGGFSNALLEAIRAANDANILFVAAAGNSGTNNDVAPFYPANYDSPNIISVAATDHNDALASFSNYGPTLVDVAAPGVNILSTIPGGYGYKSGTSMATPMVSGAVALLRSVAPAISVAQIRDLLSSSADRLPSLAGLISSGGRINVFQLLAGQDMIAPAAIADLSAGTPTSSSILLAWTATGDDGSVGRATSYDVRYSTSPIDETSFQAAARAAGAPSPSPSGSPEAMEVLGLVPETTYYLAVKAVDDFGNAGPISNVVTAKTLDAPTFFSTPASFHAMLPSGGTTTRTLTITNAGAGTLDWSIPPPDLDLPASAPPSAASGAMRLDPGEIDGAPIAPAGDPSALGAGGPDLFGYRFVDSDQPGGPAFDWNDIAATGIPVAGLTGDDQLSSPIELGFDFSFYGNTFNSVRVSTNGFLSFTSTINPGNNLPLPNPGAPANLVAPFWSSLDFRGAERAVYVSDGSTFTVQYTGVPRTAGQGAYTFQVSLRNTGEIFFRYFSLTGTINPGTVGVQNDTRTDGLQVAFNEGYLHDGLEVRIVPLAQWLHASPVRGRLAAGESQEVTLAFDAARLPVGTYEGHVVVLDNDPLRPAVDHPVALDVSGAAAIEAQPRTIDFGTVFAGYARSESIIVSNVGTDDLVVSGIASSDPAVSVDPGAFTLAPGGKTVVSVTYAPGGSGGLAATLSIESNASNDPSLAVLLAGDSIPPPSLTVTPPSLSETLRTGGTASRTVTVTNTGGSEVLIDLMPETGTASVLTAVPPPAVANGGFEVGNFNGWTATAKGGLTQFPWQVSREGAGFFATSRPLEGRYDAVNGFDGDAGLKYVLYQDIAVPAGTQSAELSYYDRIQFDGFGVPSTLPRIYEATIEDPNGGVLATFVHEEILLNGRAYTDLGWRQRSVNLAPFAGRTVRLMIRESIPESFTGPAIIEFDAFRIKAFVVPDWLEVQPRQAAIPAGASLDLAVGFDAAGSPAAVYQGAVRIDAAGLPGPLRVPATMTVLPAPDIVVTTEVETGDSVKSFFGAGDATTHLFAVTAPPLGEGRVDLTVNGDFGQSPETADISLDGSLLGTLGNSGQDCLSLSGSFPVDAALLATAAAGGAVQFEVRNTGAVAALCGVNTHAVRLSYRTAAASLDFGDLFTGLSRTIVLGIENRGTDVLDVSSIASDLPDFRASEPSMRLAPGTSRSIAVTFTPSADGAFLGTLSIDSNDADTPALRIPLSGTALPPPIASASPASLDTSLLEGTAETRPLTISNGGGSPLDFTLGAVPRPPGIAAPGTASTIPPASALVTEFGSGRLSIVDTLTGSVTLVIAGLNGPNKGLAIAPGGNIAYVVESLGGEIVAVDLTTKTKRIVAAGLNFPNGLALSADGTTLWVTETGTGRLLRIDPANGNVTPFAFNLAGPNGVTLNAAGTLAYVAEYGANDLLQIDLATGLVTQVASGLQGPVAIDLDDSERIAYVAEAGTGEISSVDLASGTVIALVAGLAQPGSLTLSPDGHEIFVTEVDSGTLDALDLGTLTLGRVATGLAAPVGVTFGSLPKFLDFGATSGTIPPFGSVELDVRFESAGLFSGLYQNDIEITTNDPAHPLIVVPATLTVIGIPNIKLAGQAVSLESARTYFTIGALTSHRLTIPVPPEGGASIELIANGDYGDRTETATLLVEGKTLGSVGGLGIDCSTTSGVFPLDDAGLKAAAADGIIDIQVQNSIDVGPNCATNSHLVRLTYRGSAERLDFGPVFAGDRRTLTLLVENTGSDNLDVPSIAIDSAEFVSPLGSAHLPPRSFRALPIDFAPSGIGTFSGTLTIESNDADTPVLTVSLSGEGVAPPIADAQPSSLATTLVEGNDEVRTFDLVNSGASPLDFSLIAHSHFPGALTVPFAGLSHEVPGTNRNAAPASAGGSPTGPPSSGSGPAFQGVPGDFEALNPSATALTCMVEDPVNGIVYAQGHLDTTWYRYVASSGAWQQLAPAPVDALNNGGAALLNGRIYTSYVQNGALIGVFDIGTSSWSAIPGPIGVGTANIASDGRRFLYLVVGTTFVRYDPSSETATPLPPPPFPFEPWGGLRHLDGVLYGHQGNGLTGFAKYDIASGVWTELPPLPGGAVAGAAIDPGSREYFTYGSYGGFDLYRYSIDAGTWKVSTIPFFNVNDGGLVWLPGPVPGILVAQGEGGSGFARYITAKSFASVSPTQGTVPPGSSLPVSVLFQSRGLLTGTYDGEIDVFSNDPARPKIVVPLSLGVIGVPRIRITGEPVSIVSSIDYTFSGARTTHRFPVTVAPAGSGTVEVIADGDYALPTESATAIFEGSTLGSVGGVSIDCTPATGTFDVDAAALAEAVADGTVEIAIQNSDSVGPLCGVNRHTVRLSYGGHADRLDYGELFVGDTWQMRVIVENVGTEVLQVASIAADLPEFSPSTGGGAIPPGGKLPVVVTFTPAAAGALQGTLTIVSDDAASPVQTVILAGTGLTPPVIDVQPSSLASTLLENREEARTLTIANLGGSPLAYSLHVRFDNAVTGLPGDFERLASSPAVLTCVAADPAGGALYGQDVFGTRFFRYLASADQWEQVAPAPVQATSGCGAALLNGRIYTSRIEDGALLSVYDIGSDAWSQINLGLTNGTANIASDGAKYLYFVVGQTFVRFDPATSIATPLNPPPFSFSPAGGLQHFEGILYGHQGNGLREFASYDILHGSWTELSSLPGGADLGSAIDPLAREYVTYGPHAGHDVYHYSIDGGGWSTATSPFFSFGDGGMGWLPGRNPGIYFVEGRSGSGFARQINEPGFVRAEPLSGTIPAFSQAEIQVTFDSNGLPPGTYATTIEVANSDRLNPLVEVPAVLGIVRIPVLALSGDPVEIRSSRDYSSIGATTRHHLPITVPPDGGGTIDLIATGDFGNSAKTATLDAEGIATVEATGTSFTCGTVSGRAAIDATDLATLVGDGVVNVEVSNTGDVTSNCAANSHLVILRYTGSPSRLDYGRVFTGSERTLRIIVENQGTDTLRVLSIASDSPLFTPSVPSMTIPPLSEEPLEIAFDPALSGAFRGRLHIVSNDPVHPAADVDLAGEGIAPPIASIAPPAIAVALPPMGSAEATRPLVVSNTGGSDLAWSATLFPAFSPATPSISGPPPPLGAGGPDAFGYVYRDSDHSGGPHFAWIDISSIGAPVAVSGNNATSAPMPLGFTFPFYGNAFTTVRVCTNGWLSFTSSRITFQNADTLPGGNPFVPENLVAPFWDDLDFGAGRLATYYNDGARGIVQFTNVPRAGGGPGVTFQVQLYPSGRIVFQYLTTAGVATSATVGIQNADKTIGHLVAYDEPYLHDGMAIAFDRLPGWLTASPLAGTLQGGGAGAIAVDLSGSGLADGDYAARIAVETNDPARGAFLVPVTLHVGEVALDWARLDPETLNLKSNGNTVKVVLQLPPAYDPHDVDVSTVSIDGILFANPTPVSYSDDDHDGTKELNLKFDRAALASILGPGAVVPVTITGEVRGRTWFRGTATVRPIRPQIRAPLGGTYLPSGATTTISWDAAPWQGTVRYGIAVSLDGGATWGPPGAGATDLKNTSFSWPIPAAISTSKARLRVTALDHGEVMGYDTTGDFSLAPSLRPPAAVGALRLDTDGADLLLSWLRPATDPDHGPPDHYLVLQAATPRGPWSQVASATAEVWRGPGGAQGGASAPGAYAAAADAIFYKVVAVNGAGASP